MYTNSHMLLRCSNKNQFNLKNKLQKSITIDKHRWKSIKIDLAKSQFFSSTGHWFPISIDQLALIDNEFHRLYITIISSCVWEKFQFLYLINKERLKRNWYPFIFRSLLRLLLKFPENWYKRLLRPVMVRALFAERLEDLFVSRMPMWTHLSNVEKHILSKC